MPKRLSDITHAYERSSEALEDAQDRLTTATESAQARVKAASADHWRVSTELRDYLKAHPDEVVVAGDYGYHYDLSQPSSIRKRPIFWAHHIWIESGEPKPEPIEMSKAAEDKLIAMASRAAQGPPTAVDQAALTAMAAVWEDREIELDTGTVWGDVPIPAEACCDEPHEKRPMTVAHSDD